jgi:hypothetical protein
MLCQKHGIRQPDIADPEYGNFHGNAARP